MATEDKLSAGPILGVVGGFVVLAVGCFEIYESLSVGANVSIDGFPAAGGLLAGGVLGMIVGLIMMIVAVLLWSEPDSHVGLGAALIVLSLISLLSLEGGLGLGFLLGVLGGTCGIVFGPGYSTEAERRSPGRSRTLRMLGTGPASPTAFEEGAAPGPPANSGARTHRACVRCGHLSPLGPSACPACGQPFEGSGPDATAPS